MEAYTDRAFRKDLADPTRHMVEIGLMLDQIVREQVAYHRAWTMRPEDREDAVSFAIVFCMERLGKYKQGKTSPISYFRSMAYHALTRHMQRDVQWHRMERLPDEEQGERA